MAVTTAQWLSRSRGASRRGFTLVELLVVIGIIALLISILIPTLARARDASNKAKCLSNLRQLGQANAMYVAAWKGWAVPGLMGVNTGTNRMIWQNNNAFRRNLNIPEWVQSPDNGRKDRWPDGMLCPSATQARDENNGLGGHVNHSYGYNMRHLNWDPKPLLLTLPVASTWDANTFFGGIKASRVRSPARKFQFMDSMTQFVQPQHSNHYYRVAGWDDLKDDATSDDANEGSYPAYRHSRDKKSDNAQINVCFWDGHAETMKRSDVAALKDPNGPTGAAGGNRTDVWDWRWEPGKP